MGRKQQAHNNNKEHIKNRKEQRIQKSAGTFKKRNFTHKVVDKGMRPPDLSKFKTKMIKSLKDKQANREETIGNLESDRKLHLHHFLEER